MKRVSFLIILTVIASSISALPCRAQDSKSLEAIELLTGFHWGKLRRQDNYRAIPLMVDFDFNLKPLTQKINFNPASLLQLQVEPFISTIIEPKANVETGVSFLLKLGLAPQSSKLQPYAKIGIGLSYMSLHTIEQGSQFNFIDSAGLGMHYFFRKNLGFTLEGRFRHLSNSGIEKPNSGINSYLVLTGITYRFE